MSGYGLVRLKADNIWDVTPNSFYVPGGTTTVQRAARINAASAGNTVDVKRRLRGSGGRDRDLTLQGTGQSGPTATMIESPTSLPAGFISSYNRAETTRWSIASGARSTLADLTVNGDGQGGLGRQRQLPF